MIKASRSVPAAAVLAVAIASGNGCGPSPADSPGEPAAAGSRHPADGIEKAPSGSPVDRPSRRPTGRPREISFDDVKFEIEKGDPFTADMLPKRVTALEGERIRIRGYILPSFQQEGLTQFVLVRDNMECCFGPGAALYDCIVVRMVPGRTANFSIRPVAVTGVFRLEELRGPDGNHLAIYGLEGQAVE